MFAQKDHQCARSGCHVEVSGYMLACQRDWRLLPLGLRARILTAWQRRRRHPTDEKAISAHLDLVLEAMQVWAGHA